MIPILHRDAELLVVDKPAGVAAHPSVGWEGPTVLGALAAAGFQIATSGAPERQGVVHRLDVGTSGLMVVAKSEHAYGVLKAAEPKPFDERLAEARGRNTGAERQQQPEQPADDFEKRLAMARDRARQRQRDREPER